MKRFIPAALLLCSFSGFGQQASSPSRADQIRFEVTYAPRDTVNEPAVFLNDKLIHKSLLENIAPENIESVNVLKGIYTTATQTYHGRIQIKTINDYQPNIMSLSELREKFTNVSAAETTIFRIDNQLPHENYNSYFIDADNIHKVIVSEIPHDRQNIKVIRILTKSKDGKGSSDNIIIR